MKKRLHIKPPKSGFYLPYTVFVSMIVFVIITTSIAMYQNNVHNTHKLMELVEVETMAQMTKAQFIQGEKYRTTSNGQGNYIYPYGNVDYRFSKQLPGDTWALHMDITTKSAVLIKKMYTITVE
jgi:ribosomal protein L35AE/L33A